MASIQITSDVSSGSNYKILSYSELSAISASFYRDKFIISSWNTKLDGSGKQIALDEVFYNISADNNIYAQWTGRTYMVTLNKDGGTCTDLTSYRYLEGATLPTDWIKEGYNFTGWKDNEELTGDSVSIILSTESSNKQFWASSVAL